jgi:hypothetical protein
MENVTIEKLKEIAFNNNVYNAIEWATKQYGDYPRKPNKPPLRINANSSEVKAYAALLEVWENDCLEYDLKYSEYKLRISEIDDVIVEFIKEQSGLLNIPKQYQDKVYSKAYCDGHSEGHYGIFQCLEDLVDIFN